MLGTINCMISVDNHCALLGYYFFYSRSLKMGPISCPETSVRIYHYSLRSKPQECSFRLFRGGSLESRRFLLLLSSNERWGKPHLHDRSERNVLKLGYVLFFSITDLFSLQHRSKQTIYPWDVMFSY